jgi:hypothetical protein
MPSSEGAAALAADGVLIAHALFVGFVVLGQIAILGGLLAHRAWARGYRLRVVHLVCVLFVVVQTWLGVTCPLTTWEHELRLRAGQVGYERGFVADWLHRLIFYEFAPWVFTVVYTAFGLAVVLTWWLAPPRRRRDRSALRR